MRLTLHSAISRPIGGHAVVGGQRCVCAPFRAVGAPLRAVDSTTDATPLSPDGAYSSDVGTLGGYESSFEEEEREKARRKLRPLVPTIDTNQLVEVLFGTSGGQPKAGGVSAELEWLFRMKENMGTSPRLYSPRVAIPPGTPPASTLPLLVYLPGLDGTGLAAYRQFPSLRARFDLRALFIPPDDRSSFEGLVEHVQALLSAEALSADPSRPIYLLGESFGGVLALVLASRCDFVDRIIIVNPATSFADSPWPALGPILTQLPAQLYATLPIALSPVLANPITMAMHNMDSTDPVPRQISDVAYGLIDMLTELNALRVALPPATLAHRLSLLKEGAEFVIDKRVLGAVPQRTLLLVGQLDLVVPSNAEGPRIVKEMQRCRLRVLQLRAHAMLQEAGVSLVDIMDEEGFYQATRLLSSGTSSSDTMPTTTTPTSSGDSDTESHATSSSTAPPAHTAHSADNGSAPTAAAASSRTPVVMAVTAAPPPPPPPRARPAKGGATFGTAAPLQMPTMRELDKAMETGGLNVLERLVSPVFFSTQADGRVVRGLGAIPDDRPILFVGNHQLFAPDMPLMVAQFLREKKTLLRGLAHPIAVGGPGAASAAGPATASGGGGASGAAAGGDGGGAAARGAGAGSFGAFLKTFGAVPVSGSNLYRLLAQGESVLLYPGGAREANKRRGEKYALLWPRKQEFVRMAARLGATIIPFAAIGAEDSINIMADSDAVLDLPVVGPMLRQRMKDAEPATIPAARRGVNALSADEANLQETFSVPFITPNAPARFYFVFRRPIQTSPALASDRAACDTLYATVKGECEGGLSYLLRKRLQDPYADFGQRMLWEGIRGFREQAPTFEP